MTFNNAAVSDWVQKVQSQHLQRTELSWEGTGKLLVKWERVNSLMEPEMERGWQEVIVQNTNLNFTSEIYNRVSFSLSVCFCVCLCVYIHIYIYIHTYIFLRLFKSFFHRYNLNKHIDHIILN